MAITREEVKAKLEANFVAKECPVCGEDDIEEEGYLYTESGISIERRCLACSSQWEMRFIFTEAHVDYAAQQDEDDDEGEDGEERYEALRGTEPGE